MVLDCFLIGMYIIDVLQFSAWLIQKYMCNAPEFKLKMG